MRTSLQEKRAFYSQPEISELYEEQRFGGASGARVHTRELELVWDLLPPEGRVLDLACGTGRLTRALASQGRPVVGLDSSWAMASKAASSGAPTVLGDAFALPFHDGAFEAIVAMRLAFHYREIEPLLAAMRPVISSGGALIFDTYSWSPRAVWALGAQRWGGRVFVHSSRRLAEAAARSGLRIRRAVPCFLFSPYLYRLAPLRVERALEALEPRVPPGWLCRVFWKLSPA